jgi:hypothetical protein
MITNLTDWQMRSKKNIRFAAVVFLALTICVLSIAGTSHALTSLSQNYTTAKPIPTGSIVSLKDNSSDEVVVASSSNVDNLIGIVINASDALIALTSDRNNQVQVATSGTVRVLASDINGPIRQGDHITASPIIGIGMKATDNIRVAGIAQNDLTEANAERETYIDENGVEQTILVGQVPVIVNVSYFFKEPERTIIPSALQNIANALAGKTVSTLPIVLSAAVFLIMLIVVVSIIYSMIRSSIISVGRNPLSQSAIYRDVIQISALVLGILAVGLISIYLILTRL